MKQKSTNDSLCSIESIKQKTKKKNKKGEGSRAGWESLCVLFAWHIGFFIFPEVGEKTLFWDSIPWDAFFLFSLVSFLIAFLGSLNNSEDKNERTCKFYIYTSMYIYIYKINYKKRAERGCIKINIKITLKIAKELTNERLFLFKIEFLLKLFNNFSQNMSL